MPRHAQDRDFELKKNLYPVDGTDQDWHRFANGTVALLGGREVLEEERVLLVPHVLRGEQLSERERSRWRGNVLSLTCAPSTTSASRPRAKLYSTFGCVSVPHAQNGTTPHSCAVTPEKSPRLSGSEVRPTNFSRPMMMSMRLGNCGLNS